jgi:hypothetical protein
MKKWPMNGALGAATRRYFMLHNDEISYHRRPPTNYESCIATPYVLRYDDHRSSSVEAVSSPGGDAELIKTIHITPHTRVTTEKARVGLLYSCMNIK